MAMKNILKWSAERSILYLLVEQRYFQIEFKVFVNVYW